MKAIRLFPLIILSPALFVLAACSGQTTTAETGAEQINCPAEGETAAIKEARLYVEYNATDGDLGVQGGFDDDGWSVLCVYAPNGDQLLSVKPQSQLGDLTMGSILFESREPELDEFSFDDLAGAFPEGEYEVRALSYEGEVLTGAATFSHNVPAGPVITSPALAEDEESAADARVATSSLVVNWQDVTETVAGNPVTITAYEVIVTKVGHDDPHGLSRPIFDVHIPPDRNSLSVPDEFLEPDTAYELEVLALEVSGNQTISVGFFQTE